MKFSNVFWGVILIFLGILFVLQNLSLIYFDWHALWRLWPVILVLWGISILPAKSGIKLGLVLVVLAGTLYFMFNQTVGINRYYHENTETWDNTDRGKNINQTFNIPFHDTVPSATLDLDAVAGSFFIEDTTSQLLEFDKRGSWGRYSYVLKTSEDNTKVIIQPEDDHHIIIRDNKKNDVNIDLNPYPAWNLNLDVGASAIKFDLTPFKIKSIDIDAGAASFKIKLGDLYSETNVNIDAGASSIKLEIPEGSGCDLKISSVFSGKTIHGFEKIDRGHYRTDNFEASKNKIFINVDAAVSSYTITRY